MIAPNSDKLGLFLAEYIAKRVDVKQTTRDHFDRARRNLIEFLGADTPLSAITPADGDDFRAHLLTTMADNTVRRICGRAKQFFRYAVRKRLLTESPFDDMRGTHVRANRSRDAFITPDMAYKVMDACPDNEWRLIFALSRWGGLRCTSEHLALEWSDVRWLEKRIRIPSPKTAHHPGRDFRMIPLFPEVRSWLLKVFEEQGWPTSGPVIVRHRPIHKPDTKDQTREKNWRTRLKQIIVKAGLEPWPKVFQNLRATRETELADSYPLHIVVAWLGNSEAVAMAHYLQVTDDYFDRAAKA